MVLWGLAKVGTCIEVNHTNYGGKNLGPLSLVHTKQLFKLKSYPYLI